MNEDGKTRTFLLENKEGNSGEHILPPERKPKPNKRSAEKF